MFCTNCGTKFEGNFCPNCGTPAFSSPAPGAAPVEPVSSAEPLPVEPVPTEPSKYPAPPVAIYAVGYGATVTVGENSITIDKEILNYGKTCIVHNEIPYSDIAAVSFCEVNPGKKKVRCCLSIRPVKVMHIPFCNLEYEFSDDPFSISHINQEKGLLIYDFLKTVAEINAYQLPEPEVLPKKFRFQTLLEYTEYRVQGENPELQAAIQEKKQQGIACCPKCGSTSLSADKQGYSVGKAAFGSLLTGNKGLGLLAGSLGANKTVVTCLNCGHKWNP